MYVLNGDMGKIKIKNQSQSFFIKLKSRKLRKCLNHQENDLRIDRVSELLLFNANSAIYQLYHGENNLNFNEMMMRSVLY